MLLAVCATVLPARGSIVSNFYFSGVSETNFPASATDLINVGQPTLLATDHVNYAAYVVGAGTSSVACLNDGSLGIPSSTFPASLNTVAFDLDGVWTSTFTLNTSNAPCGYTITNISVMAGWLASRANQQFEVLYSTVSDTGFTSLGTFSHLNNLSGSSKIEITDSTGAIVSGVERIRFAFQVPPLGAATLASSCSRARLALPVSPV